LGGGIYTAPMDHSYRALQGNNSNNNPRKVNRGRMGQAPGRPFVPPDPEPVPTGSEGAPTRIFAFVDDLFFLAKIQETARKMNVKVEFVKTDKDLHEKIGQNGDDKPSLIIFDLNNAGAKPLTTIPKLKSKLKKATNIIGFVSHVQGELKMKAQEAGCDMVLPRSAFSQNLPQLLRRHGAPDEVQEPDQQPGPPPAG
jgi:CheY-like chemotaxis protein